ncbi:MAG: FapA family protein, partial [Desulfobacula sp.]|nr:FapA family protein [Desulfobacula sp.]
MVTLKTKKKIEKESIELLELALSCKMITLSQEKQALEQILEHSKKNPKISIARFLYLQKILDKDQIEFLFAVKKHISTLMLDKKFGRVGVANAFVSQEKIDKALMIQVEIFKQRKKSVKIGDILENNNEITQANKTAILLTQDRIRDEFLADALNAIAASEMERLAINKRFGAIAVKKELITTDQLNQALKFQKKEAKKQGKKRYLGEILEQLYDLSDKQTMVILKIQKKLEAKRMNLQKKVFAFNVERESIKMLDQFLELRVSDDKLSATILKKRRNTPEINAGDVVNWLANAGIKYGVCSKKEITGLFKKTYPGKKIKIALGLAPVIVKKEQIEFAFETISDTVENDIAAKDGVLVKKDEILATVTPFVPGTPGKDVFGHPISIEQDASAMLNSGEGVVRIDNEFIAVIDGRPQIYENRTLFVIPVKTGIKTKQIEGDITKETENQYLGCDLNVSGNILAGAAIACHSLIIKGDVLGNVTATSDIEIDGNIGDHENMQSSIRIVTQGKLLVSGKVTCAQIITDKGLTAPHADVINSRIFSSGDVMVKNIRSSKDTPTVVRIAMKNFLEFQRIEKAIKQGQKELDTLTHRSERDGLTKKMIEQVQVQNGYLEKQNAISYLVRLMDLPDVKDVETLEKTIKS